MSGFASADPLVGVRLESQLPGLLTSFRAHQLAPLETVGPKMIVLRSHFIL